MAVTGAQITDIPEGKPDNHYRDRGIRRNR